MKTGIKDFIGQVYGGRTIYRLLFNRALSKLAADLEGSGLDLASGGRAGYYNYLPPGLTITKSDYYAGLGIDVVLDVNKPLPVGSKEYDFVLFFNALYVVRDREALMQEIYRILKPGGKLLIASPFVANEMPEPEDFCRLTAQGLEKLLSESGFKEIKVDRFGERFTSAVYLIGPIFFLKTIRLFAYSLCIFFDRLIPSRVKKLHPTPLGYLVSAIKPIL